MLVVRIVHVIQGPHSGSKVTEPVIINFPIRSQFPLPVPWQVGPRTLHGERRTELAPWMNMNQAITSGLCSDKKDSKSRPLEARAKIFRRDPLVAAAWARTT